MGDTSQSEPIVVLMTAGNDDEAARIARGLVERRLAACVNVVPGVRSIYAWQGEICDDGEILLIAKTVRSRFDALAATVRELHSYDVPEIVALPTAAVDSAYAAWLGEAVDAKRLRPARGPAPWASSRHPRASCDPGPGNSP